MAETPATGLARPSHPLHQRRSGRNWGLFGLLFGMVALIFAVTLVKDPMAVKNPSTKTEGWGTSLQGYFKDSPE